MLAENENSYAISAGTGDGVELLVEKIVELGRLRQESGSYLIPHSRADLVARLRKDAQIKAESFTEEGIQITVLFKPGMKSRWEHALQQAGLLPEAKLE